MIAYILGLILTGLIVGALARLLMPGPDPMSIGATILLGIAGAFIGGLVVGLLFHRGAGLIAGVLASMALLALMRRRRGALT